MRYVLQYNDDMSGFGIFALADGATLSSNRQRKYVFDSAWKLVAALACGGFLAIDLPENEDERQEMTLYKAGDSVHVFIDGIDYDYPIDDFSEDIAKKEIDHEIYKHQLDEIAGGSSLKMMEYQRVNEAVQRLERGNETEADKLFLDASGNRAATIFAAAQGDILAANYRAERQRLHGIAEGATTTAERRKAVFGAMIYRREYADAA